MDRWLRFLLYVVRKLSMAVIIVLIIILASFISYDSANIYVVVTDGMSNRAETIVKRQGPDTLDNFFTQRYLNSEPLFINNPYQHFIINDYYHRISIKRLWVWPWQDNARVVINEEIPNDTWKYNYSEELKQMLEEERLRREEELASLEEENSEDANDGADEDGEIEDDADDEAEDKKEPVEELKPPEWQNGQKVVELIKDGQGNWKIDRIVLLSNGDN